MFRNTIPAAEPEPVDVAPANLTIPISHLGLDLPEPSVGWLIELDRRHIDVLVDDVGRKAISRDDARTLIAEQHENEARAREVARRQEQQAIEDDARRRASIWGGLPWYEIPDGVAPAAAMLQSAHDARPRRQSVLQEALSGESLTYHPIQSGGDES